MKYAVIKTGGKQYLVKENEILKVEKLAGKKGDKVSFDQVLMVFDGKTMEVGKPTLKIKIEAEILEQARDKKVKVVKYKSKTRYKRTMGHRQHFTKVKIGKF